MTNLLPDDHFLPPDPAYVSRLSGIPTFMRLPYVPDPGEVDIAIAGIPYDGGSNNRVGARHGPRQIRYFSNQIKNVHRVSLISPFEICRIADVGDVPVNPMDITDCLARIETFFTRIHEAGARPFAVGGDHLVSLPVLRAIAKDGPVGMVHFDSHNDMADYFIDEKFRYNHGTMFRRAVEEGLIDPKRTVQIGLRGPLYNREELEFARDVGVRAIDIEEFFEIGPEETMKIARDVVGSDPIYVSFDIDALDAGFVPGTGAPEIGGYTPRQAQEMIRKLQGLNIIGCDLVEVSPPLDPLGTTAILAAGIMFELVCVLADSVARNK